MELYDQIKSFVLTQTTIGTSKLCREFNIDYNEAVKVMDRLEEEGVVTKYLGDKHREVIKK